MAIWWRTVGGEPPVASLVNHRSRSILANLLAAANWFLFLTGGLAFILMIARTRTEEQNLLARFGDSYRAYVERTGRCVPRIGAQRRGT